MRKAFARWRLRVWDARLKQYRKDWEAALGNPETGPGGRVVPVDREYETLATKALVRRTKWRKRAGVRTQGGPVTPGRPYLRGEKGPELFIPAEPGRKVSPPADRPES